MKIKGADAYNACSWWGRYKWRKRIEREVNREHKSTENQQQILLLIEEKKERKLRKARHMEGHPFCQCKYCWAKVEDHEQWWDDFRKWQSAFNPGNVFDSVHSAPSRQCEMCGETMPRYGNHCDACGYFRKGGV